MCSIIITAITLSLLGPALGSQDVHSQNVVQNDVSFQNHPNSQYFVHPRQILMQNYPQHYVPVPIQLLQRSVYTQQPQAALIIVKAFPVYLTPAQAANIQSQSTQIHQDLPPRIPNVHTVHYSSAPVYSTSQPTSVYPTTQTAPEKPSVATSQNQASSYVAATNPGLYFAPPSSVQGDNYLNQLAQVVAQQYAKSPSNYKAPAIIAGLENFSQEQQNQIKNHLKNYISSHADGEKQEKGRAEQRVSNDSQEKYSSKIPARQYPQQTDWRPAHQPNGGANSKN